LYGGLNLGASAFHRLVIGRGSQERSFAHYDGQLIIDDMDNIFGRHCAAPFVLKSRAPGIARASRASSGKCAPPAAGFGIIFDFVPKTLRVGLTGFNLSAVMWGNTHDCPFPGLQR
jgi:hypothetical protein